jgi:Cu2+-exporting ATPase
MDCHAYGAEEGIGKAAEKQILIKDATALENLRKVDVLVTDKTGTLTIPNQNIDFTKADDLPLEGRETLKPNAREAMTELRRRGIDVYMMSGDKHEAAKYWAEKAGIAHYQSKVLPHDKEQLVKRLQDEGHRVAMIGDGINATQALAQADVSNATGVHRRGHGRGTGYADGRRPQCPSRCRDAQSQDGAHDLAEPLLGLCL